MRSVDLRYVIVRMFVFKDVLGQARPRTHGNEISCRIEAKRINEFLGRALSWASVSDFGSIVTARLRRFAGRGGIIEEKNKKLMRSKLLLENTTRACKVNKTKEHSASIDGYKHNIVLIIATNNENLLSQKFIETTEGQLLM